MEFHEAANIFPLLEGEEFEGFIADIRAKSQQDPIALLDGVILDGRNRWRACERLGIEPRTKDLPSGTDPVAYVISANAARRHLTPAQRAMSAVRADKLMEKYKNEARERQAATRKKGTTPVPVNLPERDKGDARDQLGKQFRVSGKSIDYAKKVLKAIPEVIKAVDEGRMAVSTAAILSTEPEEVQRKEATAPKRRRNYKSVSTPPTTNGRGTQQQDGHPQPEPSVGNGAGKVSLQRQRSLEAAESVIDFLKRSPLMQIGVKNPHRDYAFAKVIRWLRVEQKRKGSYAS